MDPLADFTALSPHDQQRARDGKLGESEDVSQQCSADPSAFIGMQRPSVVVAAHRARSTGEMRLALDVSASASQHSQYGGSSQPQSQFNELFLQDTQQDDDEEEAEVESRPLERSTAEPAIDVGVDHTSPREGSFLARIDQHLGASSSALPVAELQKTASNPGYSSADADDASPVIMDHNRDEDPDATPVRHDYDYDDGMEDDRGSEESYDATQPLEDEDEEGDDRSARDTDDDIGYTEVFPDTFASTEVLPDTLEDDKGPSPHGVMEIIKTRSPSSKDTYAEAKVEDEDGDDRNVHETDGGIGYTEAFPDTFASTEVVPETLDDDKRHSTPDEICTIKTRSPASKYDSEQDQVEEEEHGEFVQGKRDRVHGGARPIDTEDQTLVELAERMTRERAEAKHDGVEDSTNSEELTLADIALRIRQQRERRVSSDQDDVFVQNTSRSGSPSPPLQLAGRSIRYAPSNAISQDSESQEQLTPTQPSSAIEAVALKKREKGETSLPRAGQDKMFEFFGSQSACQCGDSVCGCATHGSPVPVKQVIRPSSAIRNLQLAFAAPGSQESESQMPDSLPDLGALALRTLEAVQSVKSPATGDGKSSSAQENPIHQTPVPPKRRQEKRSESDSESTPRKKPKNTTHVSSPGVLSTPSTSRKRGRTFLSPDAGAESLAPNQMTPTKSSRKAPKNSSVAAPSPSQSTPSVRTRTRILSPVPSASSRKSASRSRSLFRSKYDFCITGFMGEGEMALAKLIEDYGGKVHSDIIDVLQRKSSSKAMVIATPVSWRKLKFMYAVAAGIPVVHPEWIHACARQGQVISVEGYRVPSGYSVTTAKFECLSTPNLNMFQGLRVGIPRVLQRLTDSASNPMSDLVAFILRSHGANSVDEDLVQSREKTVDVVVSEEYTKVCDYYATKHQVPVKSFAWVTECMILQRLLVPSDAGFAPLSKGQSESKRGTETVNAVTAQIGDGDSSENRTTLKLYTGELVLVDLRNKGVDHFLLFDVCEILSIHLVPQKSKRRNDDGTVRKTIQLHVGVLERYPYSPKLHRRHVRVLDLSPEKIKRRVVAVSKEDFDAMKYRDESIFYYED